MPTSTDVRHTVTAYRQSVEAAAAALGTDAHRSLTDEEARPHTSFLKDLAPLPSRNLTFGARRSF